MPMVGDFTRSVGVTREPGGVLISTHLFERLVLLEGEP